MEKFNHLHSLFASALLHAVDAFRIEKPYGTKIAAVPVPSFGNTSTNRLPVSGTAVCRSTSLSFVYIPAPEIFRDSTSVMKII